MTTLTTAFAPQLDCLKAKDGSGRVYFIGQGHPSPHGSWEVLSTTEAELPLLDVEWELLDDVNTNRAPGDLLPRLRHKGYPLAAASTTE